MRPPREDNARLAAGIGCTTENNQRPDTTPPIVTGQTAWALQLIREYQPLLSFRATANFAIPEFAARVHDLRGMGFNVVTQILPEVVFRGCIRRRVALYSLGFPEWPRPGFFDAEGVKHD